MASVINKRQQARNERILQDLLKSVAGNDRCADCAARNPGWASWSLGIFLCMSCAALHRKMGTHISKVKSLTMDSWTQDQVDNMKRVGNVVSNRTFNPQNVKPDIPFDADEVGGVMERFIRQKYELKGFVASSTARRHTVGQTSIASFDDNPPPLPPKPGKKFGFLPRSASATQPKFTPPLSPALTDSDGRSTPPRMNKPSRVFGSAVGNQDNQEENFDAKLTSLREMGFPDTRRNSMVLKSVSGNIEKAIEALVRLGDGATGTLTPGSAGSSNANGLHIERRRQEQPSTSSIIPPPPSRRSVTQPLPSAAPNAFPDAPQMPQQGYNPFFSASSQPPAMPQPQPPLQDSFQGLQISNAQPQQYPQHQNNPFMPQHVQQPMHAPTSTYQPEAQYQQPSAPAYAPPEASYPQSNPFLRQTKSQTFTPSNPFGLPQSATPQNPWMSQPQQVQTPTSMYTQQQDFFAQQPAQLQPQRTAQPYLPSQPQPPQVQQSTQQYQQPQMPPQRSASNPYQIQPQPSHQPEPAQSYQAPQQYTAQPYQQQQQQQQQQQFYQPQTQQPYQQQQPQQSYQPQAQQSRFDKNSILNLYNYPQMAPSRPLQSLPEGSIAPDPNAINAVPQRSVTMPVITNNMNPFAAAAPPQNMPGAGRHVSQESVDFVGLGNGRQSPDAFAGLSARYAR